MGFAASQGRLGMLVGRKNDLEQKLQKVQEARIVLGDALSRLMQQRADQGASATEPKNNSGFERDKQIIAQEDKKLEMEANRIDKQREAAVTEIQAVRKVVSKNIQQSFSLGAG